MCSPGVLGQAIRTAAKLRVDAELQLANLASSRAHAWPELCLMSRRRFCCLMLCAQSVVFQDWLPKMPPSCRSTQETCLCRSSKAVKAGCGLTPSARNLWQKPSRWISSWPSSSCCMPSGNGGAVPASAAHSPVVQNQRKGSQCCQVA